MAILTQFLFRLAFELAVGMAVTSPRQVTSGYFRNHLYVLLGLNVLAAMVAAGRRDEFSLAPPIAGALLSYAGAVAWLYEKPRAGNVLLWLVGAAAAAGMCVAPFYAPRSDTFTPGLLQGWLQNLDAPTSGLLLGTTIAAMFLGHWYLNTPTMRIEPLMRLMAWMAAATLLRAVVCAAALSLALISQPALTERHWPLLVMHWLAGLVATAVLTWMSWQTLRIPNTQSATGILYVAVIATFLGELTSLLVSTNLQLPM